MTLLDEYRRAFSSPVNPMPDNHAIVPQLSDEQTSEAGYGAPNPGEEPKIAGSRPELIDLTSKERPGGEHPSITPTDQFKRPRTDVGRFNDYALRYVRKLNKDGDHILTELVIGSPFIQQALRSILSSYSFLNLAADPIVIPKPFAPLFHYREELEEYTRSAERTDVEATHMRALMNEFFKLYMEDTRRIFTEEVPKGRVRFEYLWTLFRAEDDIIVHNEYFREMHRVVHCEVTITNAGRKFNIYTWRWGYNAGKFGPCAETIIIHEFASTRRIQQLSCFPVKLLLPEEQAKLNQDLIDRGRQWRQLISPKQRLYNGPIWTGDPSVRTMLELDIQHSNGRIMLDHQQHAQTFAYLIDQLIGVHGYRLNGRDVSDSLEGSSLPAIKVSSGGGIKYTSRAGVNKKIQFSSAQCFDDDEHYEMSDEEALLSPARTRGFSLSEKVSAFFLVDQVREVDYREKAFDSLMLEPSMKGVVRALVETHDPASKDFDDLVAGKGKGIIILLEGPPGSGKTLMAESTAELTHRPLYTISASELGTNAQDAERALRTIFKGVERWNAILLLDEADLFLTKRTPTELDRNALVTVFLRNMEYFGGLMFLTTNRVEDFDPAFDSRIHLRVPFSSLDAHARAAIWRHFLPDDIDSDLPDRLGQELKINGREIKNMMRTAQLIAKHRNVPLSEDIIKDVCKANLHRA